MNTYRKTTIGLPYIPVGMGNRLCRSDVVHQGVLYYGKTGPFDLYSRFHSQFKNLRALGICNVLKLNN